ncbi:MAG: GTP-binding protein [Spirochaetales bacterium]|nr:GTP-binding protein [Spirochaetales bacterium]
MIPITVVTGFLGAGKTSLIAHLLDTAERRIAVVVNDLAVESIDVAFLRGGEHIAAAGDDAIRVVAGGRAGSGKLADVIDQIESLARLPEAPEAIVVETSGSSPSAALSRAIDTEGELGSLVYLDRVVAMVDVTSFTMYWKDRELRALLEDQIVSADLIVLNKNDRARFRQRRRTRRAVRRLNRDAEIGVTVFGRLPVEEIVATGRRRGGRAGETGESAGRETAATSPFQPIVARHLKEARPFHPERLDAWLSEPWPGIVRVKGFVWIATDMEHVFVLDVAGAQRELGMEGTWYGALDEDELPEDREVRDSLSAGPWQDRQQSITIIGTSDAVERELRRVRGCLLSDPELERGPQGWSDMADPILPRFVDDEAADAPKRDQSK